MQILWPRGLRPRAPWYRLGPTAALVVAVGLFLGIGVLAWFFNSSADDLTMLSALPIALMAVTFGLRGGLGSAAVGFALLRELHGAGALDAGGWIVRALAMFLLGGLLGQARDQLPASEEAALEEQAARHALEDANRRYAEGVEISESLLQHLSVAKWRVEQERAGEAALILTTVIERGEQTVARLLPRRVSSVWTEVGAGSGAPPGRAAGAAKAPPEAEAS